MPPKREKLGFVPAGKAEFLKGAGDPARGGSRGFVPNQQIGKPRSAPEIHSDWEEIKNFPFSCMKTPPNPNTAQPSEATTFYPMEYPNSIVEYPSSFVEYPSSSVPFFPPPQIPRETKSFLFPLLDNSCSFLFGPGLNHPVPSSRWHLLRVMQCSR